MICPVIEAYAQAPARIQVGFGNPALANTPTGLQQDTGAVLPPAPPGTERIGVLTECADRNRCWAKKLLDNRPSLCDGTASRVGKRFLFSNRFLPI
ncbi:MAG: hypothetical protein AAF716_19840 [Cyanobacteria bacterium P01_D01_bin.1]